MTRKENETNIIDGDESINEDDKVEGVLQIWVIPVMMT